MKIRIFPFAVVAAIGTGVWIAPAPSLGMSQVASARAQELAVQPAITTDATPAVPESPLAVARSLGAGGDLPAGPLDRGRGELVLQLEAAGPAQRDVSLHDFSVDVLSQ